MRYGCNCADVRITVFLLDQKFLLMFLAIASASAKAIPDKFKDDIDSMSATALSGQYKRVISDLQDKINSIQDDLLQISTLEHVYLKKQLGEHLHEKLFNKPNDAEKSVIEDALKEYKFKVDIYM